MPDVGVLQLSIRDNSTTAAGGLTQLSDALRAVKDACKGGLNLSNGKNSVAQQIQTLANTVRSESTVIKNLGTLFNAISNFSKLKDIQINTKPILELKSALEGGMNIGKAGTEINKLREALTGDWGNEQSISVITTGMSNIAAASSELQSANTAIVIRNVAKSIKEYASAVESISGGGAHDYLSQQVFASFSDVQTKSTGTNIARGIKEGIDSEKEAVRSASVEMVKEASDAADQELGIHSPSYVYYKKGEMSGVGYAEGFISTKGEIQTAVKETLSLASEGVKWALNAPNMVDMDAFRQSVMPDALTSLGQKYIYAGDAAKSYTENINAAIPALREYRDTALSVQSKQDLAGFSKKTGEDLATPIKEAEQAIVQSTDNIREHVQETVAVVQEAVKEGYGTGSIKGLYEDSRLGPTLGGFFGSDAQMAMIKKVAEVTGLSVDEIKRQLVELSGDAVTFDGTIKSTCSSIQDSVEKVTGTVKNAGETAKSNPIVPIDQLIEAYDHADYLKQKIEELKRILETKREMGILTSDETDSIIMKIRRLQEEYRKLTGEVEKTKDENSSLSFSFRDLKKGIEKMFPTLTSLFKSFTRMAKMRAIRYVIRQIAAGFKEGTQNVYEYSKAIGSTFHESMDEAASSLAQMKNALGAQLAPILQMLIPVLQNVVNWFINILNVANQFFSLLNGQKTWTRALPQTVSAFDKQKKAAKGASAALKELLADWDELNIIQSETGGSGGSSGNTAEDYLKMFEEVGTFDHKIKDTVTWIQDHMDAIKTVAEAIGIAILSWKISRMFGDTLTSLQRLSIVAGLTIMITGIVITVDAAEKIAKDGLNLGNALELAGGIAATALGGAWVGSIAAKALGFTAAGGAIAGAITGVLIGLGFAIATIHAKTIENAYGTLTEDAETIRENVMSYFKPNIEAEVNVVKAKINDTETAEKKVGEALAILEKDYPVAIQIKSKEALKQLKVDIDSLVLSTKELIIQRKANIRSTVLESGQFEDDKSFIKFSDEQWNKTEEYVEKLGEEMGRLISQGITKGAELDELQRRLSNIVRAVTYGQRSGEFVGKMSIAGSKLRNAEYSKDAFKAYIDTYLSEHENYANEATAAALSEKADLKALYESVYERYLNNDATEGEVERAWNAYNNFDVVKEAERYAQKWLGEGDKEFAKILLEGLSTVMSKTDNSFIVQSMRENLSQFASNKLGRNAEQYQEDLDSYIIKTIAESTGQDQNSVKKLLEYSGIDPLSMFGDEFASMIRDNIANALMNSGFSKTDVQKIAEKYGIDMEEYMRRGALEAYTPQTQEVTDVQTQEKIKEAEEAVKQQSSMIDLWNELNGILSEYRIDYINANKTNPEGLQGMKQLINDLYRNNEAESLQTLIDYINQYGVEGGFEHWNQIGPGSAKLNPARVTGGMGVSDVGWMNEEWVLEHPLVKQSTSEDELTEADFARAVETGSKAANANQNALLEEMITLLGRIAGKNFTVNITPSSAAGAWAGASTVLFNKITG